MIKNNQIEIYRTADNQTQVEVRFEEETVWLSQQQMAALFNQTKQNISLHINNCYREGELKRKSTVKEYLTVQTEGSRKVKRNIEYYNLDTIISVGYRVKSIRGTEFRQWATKRLKDYLIKGYAINERRLAEKQQEVEYLKTGIRILNRAVSKEMQKEDAEMLQVFADGLTLLDDYDHGLLDNKSKSIQQVIYPSEKEYLNIISKMASQFNSGVFAQPLNDSFTSSIKQIAQSFDGIELYPGIEEKAATLLYLIVKNHSFTDGNKRIAAACFLYFMEVNQILFNENRLPIISGEALAHLHYL